MSIKNSLKGFFFEDEPVASEGTTTQQKPVSIPKPIPNTAYAGATSVQPTTSASSNGKMKERLEVELSKHLTNSPYSQYQKMNISMKSKITDVSTRCIALGVALEGQGITKQKLVEGTNAAVAFLNTEASNFLAAVSDTSSNWDKQLKAKTDSVLAAIDEKQKAIAKLTEEITSLQREKTEFEIKVSQEKGQLETSKVEFSASFNEIMQEVNKDINDITTYLGV